MLICDLIYRQYEIAKSRGWDRAYWAIDLHSTVIVPDYKATTLSLDFYPGALEAMQRLTDRRDACLLMYTCSTPDQVELYVEMFAKVGVRFDLVNENTEVKNQGYGCYDYKPYFNILLDDKAGFTPEVHWREVMYALDDLACLGGGMERKPMTTGELGAVLTAVPKLFHHVDFAGCDFTGLTFLGYTFYNCSFIGAIGEPHSTVSCEFKDCQGDFPGLAESDMWATVDLRPS